MNAALLVHGGGGWKKSTLPGGDTTLVVEVGDVGVPSFSFSALALDPFVAFGLALFRGLFAPAAELDIFLKINEAFFSIKPAAPYFLPMLGTRLLLLGVVLSECSVLLSSGYEHLLVLSFDYAVSVLSNVGYSSSCAQCLIILLVFLFFSSAFFSFITLLAL